MGKVLVLGRDSRAFLAVIRSLGRAGIRVDAAWSGIEHIPRKSRYLTTSHDVPEYRENDPSWLAAMTALLERERYDLVIPTNDTPVAALQLHKRELGSLSRLQVLSDEAYDVLSDKRKSASLARAHGVPVPQEIEVHSVDQPPPGFGLPLVLKPLTSYDAANPGSRREVRKVYSASGYQDTLREVLRGGPVLVQENVPGRGAGVELLLREGEPLLEFQHARVHEPLMGGGSSYRRSVPVSRQLRNASLAILRPLRYTGVAMVEFKVDPESGRYVFMEVNPRFWGSLPLALVAGVDFPIALYRLLVEGTVPSPVRYRSGVHCRHLTRDLEWQVANLRADRSDPTLATRPPRLVLRDAFVNVLSFREHVDSFSFDDPVPAVEEIRLLARRAATHVAEKGRAILRASRMIRRRLARRASLSAARASTVMFVCKGNVCRSPFAEQIARRDGRFARVTSAGYFPAEGRQAPGFAREVAREHGASLEDHRSRRLTASDVREADLILVFDSENLDRVVRDFPQARGKTHLLGAFSASDPLIIEDPWSRERDTFRRVYAQIVRGIARLNHVRETSQP